jgi:hypothetical protein
MRVKARIMVLENVVGFNRLILSMIDPIDQWC